MVQEGGFCGGEFLTCHQSAFTNIVLAEMSKKTGQKVAWDSFHALEEAKLVGGILVLPVATFAAGYVCSPFLTLKTHVFDSRI